MCIFHVLYCSFAASTSVSSIYREDPIISHLALTRTQWSVSAPQVPIQPYCIPRWGVAIQLSVGHIALVATCGWIPMPVISKGTYIYGFIATFRLQELLHWKANVIILTKFFSLAALEVVKMTTSSAASDEIFVKMTFLCQCMAESEVAQNWHLSS